MWIRRDQLMLRTRWRCFESGDLRGSVDKMGIIRRTAGYGYLAACNDTVV